MRVDTPQARRSWLGLLAAALLVFAVLIGLVGTEEARVTFSDAR